MEGQSDSERYLAKLCKRSFLSLWSYPNLYTDSGRHAGKGAGQELCDLLVVFGSDVIIFSDKHVQYKDTGNIEIDWKRWFKRAITKSISQLAGAESWVKRFPDRVFIDKFCTKPFPLPLPSHDQIRFHRIAVTRGSYQACARYYGGKSIGSLRISTLSGSNMPFTISLPDPHKPFVHIFDEFTLDMIFRELNTIDDFVSYLQKKEQFLSQQDRSIMVAGEEQLLAIYLTKMNTAGEHDIVLPDGIPDDTNGILLEEGFWEDMVRDPRYIAKKEADEISYVWDRLIEHLIEYADARALGLDIDLGPRDIEKALRIMAAEPRLRRRQLGKRLIEVLESANPNKRFVRLLLSETFPDIVYIFLAVPIEKDEDYNEYRKYRVSLLYAYCKVAKLRARNAKRVVGLGFDSPSPDRKGGSEDLVYLDVSQWTPELEAEAVKIQNELGLFLEKNARWTEGHDLEYPEGGKTSISHEPAQNFPPLVNRAMRRAHAARQRRNQKSRRPK